MTSLDPLPFDSNMNTGKGSETVSYADHLHADTEIPNQRVSCLSFVGTENDIILGFKVRGAFDTIEEANEHCKQIHNHESEFHISVCETGRWVPVNPDVTKIRRTEYNNKDLSSYMKGHAKSQASSELEDGKKKIEMMKKYEIEIEEKENPVYVQHRIDVLPSEIEKTMEEIEKKKKQRKETEDQVKEYTKEEIENALHEYKTRNEKISIEESMEKIDATEKDTREYLRIDRVPEGQAFTCVSFTGPHMLQKSESICIKIRGLFPTLEEAKMNAIRLSRLDNQIAVFVCETGKWIPLFARHEDQVKYQDEAMLMLTSLVKSHILNEQKMNQRDQRRKEELVKKAEYEGGKGQNIMANQKESYISVKSRLDSVLEEVRELETKRDYYERVYKESVEKIKGYTEEEIENGKKEFEERQDKGEGSSLDLEKKITCENDVNLFGAYQDPSGGLNMEKKRRKKALLKYGLGSKDTK